MAQLARFQKKQTREKEEKLLRLYEDQKQRAIDRIGKNNAGSVNNKTSVGGGKVRQMFDERRQKAGIDRSYPLEPLKQENTTNTSSPIGQPPSKIAVRINANMHKIISSSTLTSRPSNVNIRNQTNSRQTITQNSTYQTSTSAINSIKGSIKSYDDVDNKGYHFQRDQQGLLDNMNRLNIENDLDDNAMLAHIEEVQAVYNGVGGKLANVGGKLPSEIAPINNEPKINALKPAASGLNTSTTFKKEIKGTPLVKKTSSIKPAASPIRKVSSPPSTSSSSSSMSRPQSRPAQQTSARSEPPGKAGTNADMRTPNTQRPSAKQTPRGPSAVQRDDLDECRFCNRRFASDRLQVHEDICARTAKKKRKQYDATKHRLDGTELAPFATKASKISKASTSVKPNNWRLKHEEFIASIRSAKMVQQHVAKGGKLSDLPPPPPSTNADYVQCPHCGRRFNEAAAERHIPKCASFDYNKTKPGSSKGRAR